MLNHNLETVARVQRLARPSAGYARSLTVLARAKDAGLVTKSGLVLGMGEEMDEIRGAVADLRAVGVDLLTMGQYLRPSPAHLPVARWWTPEEFNELGEYARSLGFTHVESGPLVRSSYHARDGARGGERGGSRPGEHREHPDECGRVSGALLARQDRARARMAELGVDVLLLSVGADLPYLTGYEAMPLERLTMLVLPRDGEATLVVPELEAPRVALDRAGVTLRPWSETEDPVAIVAGLLPRGTASIAIGDQTWARFVLALQRACASGAAPDASWSPAAEVISSLRMVKDAEEIEALRAAAHAVDRVAAEMRTRPFSGRTEADIQREIVDRMLEQGHQKANFAIVGSGPNGASPHHDAGERVVRDGDVVVCDFGGTMHGYCSDITRMFSVGEPTNEVRDVYAALFDAQELAVQAATVGTPCEEVDAVARRALGSAGLAEQFVHRVGHGIGLDAHEDPYLVSGNAGLLEPGHAFSIEPGVYFQGRYGMRLEDIVVASVDGPDRLNLADRDLAVVG